MTLVDTAYAFAVVLVAVGSGTLGWVIRGCRCRRHQELDQELDQEPPTPAETQVLPRVGLPATGTGWPPAQTPNRAPVLDRGAEWVPRRRPSPHPRPRRKPSPRPRPDLHPPNGYAPGRAPVRGEEGHDDHCG